MKHTNLVIVTAAIVFLAVGCNKTADTTNQNTNSASTNESSNVNTNTNASSNTNTTPAKEDVFIDEANKISLDYTDLRMLTKTPGSYIPASNGFSGSAKDLLTLYLDPNTYNGTNLESAWFNLAINEIDKKTCYAISPTATANKTRKVQDDTWSYALPNPLGSGAAGHFGQEETYRLFKNNLCYEVRLGLSGFNRDNLPDPNSVKAYNSEKIFGYLGAVFNKLKVAQ